MLDTFSKLSVKEPDVMRRVLLARVAVIMSQNAQLKPFARFAI